MKYLKIVLLVMLLTAFSYTIVTAQTVEFVGSYDTPSIARGITVTDNYAYIASGSSGLLIVDVSDPENPVFTGNYQTSGTANDVCISGDYAYIAAGFSGLQIVNISNPGSPSLAGSYSTPDRALTVQVIGNYAYIADRASFQIIDISDPENPALAGSWNNSANDLTSVNVSGDYAYLTRLTYGLILVSITDPENPEYVGEYYNGSNTTYDVHVSGDYAFVVDGSSLKMINTFIPNAPTLYATCYDLSIAKSVYVSAGYAYVADFDYGLHVIYNPDPFHLTYITGYETTEHVYDVFVLNEYIYITEGSSLLILRYSQVDINEEFNLPQEFSLSGNYPNPFNCSTVISYELKQPTAIRLDIYDLLGRRIETLVNEYQQAGQHRITWDATGVNSGVYFYKMQTNEYTEMNKMILLK